MSIRKSLIPAAGFGTRMLPAAKSVPKEMLPVLDRPTIQHVVEEAASAGVDDVLLITSRDKRSLEDHFDRNAELEARLRATNKESLLASISELMSKVRVHAARQSEQLGLGHAVLQGRDHVGNHPFLCQLGDAVFTPGPDNVLPCQQLVEAYERFGTSVVGVEEVPLEKVSRYGVVGGNEIEPGILKLDTLVEKPKPESAPSRYAVAARYLLTPAIFECIGRTHRGAGGEIQLTDAIKLLLEREPVHAVVLRAKRHDIGNPLDWLKTNLVYAKRDAKLWEQLAPMLRNLLET